MNVAIDSNILAYAEGVNDAQKRDAALDLLRRLPAESTLVPVQALGELFNVLVRKANRSKSDARAAILSWGDAFPHIETSSAILAAAADLSTDHKLGFWDAVMLASAAEGRCRLLVSEDLQDGFTWSGVTVANPFAQERHPLLEALLNSTREPVDARPRSRSASRRGK